MKTILTVIALLIGIGIIVTIFPWSKDIGKGKKEDIDDWLKKQTSDTYLFNASRTELMAQLEALKDKAYRVEEIRNDLLDKEAELSKKNSELKKAEGFLQRSVEWIKSHTPNDVLSVNGKTHSYATVESDVQVRTKQCSDTRLIINAMKENTGILRKSIAEADDALQKGLMEIKIKLSQLGVTEAKLIALRQLEQTQNMINDLDLNNLQKGSSRYDKEIKDRIAKIDTDMKFSIHGDQSKISIIEDGPTVTSGLDAAEQYINTYMSAPSPSSATP